MTRLVRFSNNAVSKLASSITSSSTTITLQTGDGAKFPTLTGTQYFMATLVKSDGTTEVIKVTARSSDTLTVTRAAEAVAGVQTASAFSSGDRIEHRLTAGVVASELDRLDQAAYINPLNKSANYTITANDVTSLVRVNTGSSNVTITLPDISTLIDDFDVIIAKVTGDANVVTVARSGTDTINGATSYSLTAQWQGAWLTADRSTGTWTVIASGGSGVRAFVDTFTGSGTAGPFTLSGDPGVKESTAVYVGGVYQQKSTYTLVGSSLTLGGVVASGVPIEVVWSQPLQIGITSASQTTASDGSSGSLFTTVQGFITRLMSSVGSELIGFIQSGTGAVARMAQDKMREKVTPNDYWSALDVDDSLSFQKALDSGARRLTIPWRATDYVINTPLVCSVGVEIVGEGWPVVKSTVAGSRILGASGLGGMKITGIDFSGASSSTVPTTAFSSVAAINCGLVTLYDCPDAIVHNNRFSTFYNGLSAVKCSGLRATNNKVRNWLVYGILGSLSKECWIDNNNIQNCDQLGAANAYGIMVTGDAAAGNESRSVSICNNIIKNVKSWDGIMTHDIARLKIQGNEIEDVRAGIDIGHANATNVIDDVDVTGNTISLTTTNTWGTGGAFHIGISAQGFSATSRMRRLTIANNKIHNAGNSSGMVTSGNSAVITVTQADDATIVGNEITGVGNSVPLPGIYVIGTISNLVLANNKLQGYFAPGAIRSASLTCDVAAITGNTMLMSDTANIGIYLASGTISKLALGLNATNSAAPVNVGTSTLTYSGAELQASATWDPGSIANGSTSSWDVVCTGAAVGDFAECSFTNYLSGMSMTCEVSISNTVRVRLTNNTGAAVDLASGTVTVRVKKRYL